jgi:hypothetical protein
MFVRDDNAFLFNLSCARLFPSQHSGSDIYCGWNRGPYFGGNGGVELAAVYQSFNGENNCCSFANKPGYMIEMETDGVTNKLTRKKDGGFTITELEVWSLMHK